MKNILPTKVFLVLILLTTNVCAIKGETNNNNIKSAFHKNEEKTHDALSKIIDDQYPIGSDARILVNDLRESGFYCTETVGEREVTEATLNWHNLTKEDKKNIALKGDHSKKIKIYFNSVLCGFTQQKLFVSTIWNIGIMRDDNGKILKVTINSQYLGV
jgi:hypothetical protein